MLNLYIIKIYGNHFLEIHFLEMGNGFHWFWSSRKLWNFMGWFLFGGMALSFFGGLFNRSLGKFRELWRLFSFSSYFGIGEYNPSQICCIAHKTWAFVETSPWAFVEPSPVRKVKDILNTDILNEKLQRPLDKLRKPVATQCKGHI